MYIHEKEMHPAIIGWFSFWMVYWLAEGVFPSDERAKNIVTAREVQKVVGRNMLLLLPYSIIFWEIMPDISPYVPGTFFIRYIISAMLMDGWFYFIHRLLHHRWFYSWHKQHHRFNIPYPLVAVYCSPLEALLCDGTAIGLGPTLFKMSGVELEIWMGVMALHALLIHSSTYHGRDHNIHHAKNVCNFGLLSVFDRIFGTYR